MKHLMLRQRLRGLNWLRVGGDSIVDFIQSGAERRRQSGALTWHARQPDADLTAVT